MYSKLIISATGPDRKGIVSEISSIVNNHNGNIETSKMVRLEREFSVLILVNIKINQIKQLEKSLNMIENLTIQIIETKSNENKEYKHKFHLYINGADNEGIVYKFSNFLSKININIEEVNTKIKNAPMSATPLFMMDLIIDSEEDINQKNIKKELEIIADKLGVGVEIKKF
tara:strand:+ start:1786 stop:2301 length:516 start_codon:yes stop_codon:yes gene_type:complete